MVLEVTVQVNAVATMLATETVFYSKNLAKYKGEWEIREFTKYLKHTASLKEDL